MVRAGRWLEASACLLILSLGAGCGGSGGGGGSSGGGELTSHLSGEWSTNSIVSGAPAWWSRGRLAVTASGVTTGTLSFLGDPDEVVTTSMSLSADRVWTIGANASAQGAADALDRLLVFTGDWPNFPTPHPTEMGLAVKMAPSYATSDLAGTWETRSLGAGDGTAYWSSSIASIAADGSFVSTTTTNTGGPTAAAGQLHLSPEGATTLAGDPSFRGAVDVLKTIMVSTGVMNAGALAELRVSVKLAASYSQADLAGTWRSYTLASGPGEPWWERGSGVIDAAGNFSGTSTDSTGGSGPHSGAFTLAADGHVTTAGVPTYGVLDASKSVLVWAATWGGAYRPGTAELKVFVKTR